MEAGWAGIHTTWCLTDEFYTACEMWEECVWGNSDGQTQLYLDELYKTAKAMSGFQGNQWKDQGSMARQWGFPGGTVVKTPPANVGDVGSIPGPGRSPGGGNGNPLQYSRLGNPMDREAWWAAGQGVAHDWVTKHMIR